jgi:hypothetical protein
MKTKLTAVYGSLIVYPTIGTSESFPGDPKQRGNRSTKKKVDVPIEEVLALADLTSPFNK